MKKFIKGAYINVPSKTYTFNNCKLTCNGIEMNCAISFEHECPPDYEWLVDLINNQDTVINATFDNHSHYEKGKSIKYIDKLMDIHP